MFKHLLALGVAVALNSVLAAAQTPQDPDWTLLWPEGAPGAMGSEERDRRHGLGLASSDPVLATWADRLGDWLKGRGITN